MIKLIWIFALSIFGFAAPLCIHAKVNVVTTTQDMAALAQVIGGQEIEVFSLTPGTRDPHFAQAKPSMIRKVFRADLLLLIGADMEVGWLPALLKSARNSKVLPGGPGYLDLSQYVTLLDVPKGPVTRDMGDVHSQGNPHYWLNPANGLLMAKAIFKKLSEADSKNINKYNDNLKSFEQLLNKKMKEWQDSLLPLKNKPLIAYHTSFLYLADAFGFRIVDELEPKPGISPSPSHLNQLVERINADKIGLLILEPFYERRSADYLANKTGIKVAVLPQSVGAENGIDTYINLFDRIVSVLQQSGEF